MPFIVFRTTNTEESFAAYTPAPASPASSVSPASPASQITGGRARLFPALLAALLLLAFSLSGCASQEPLKPYNPMGVSGKVNPEAEKYFAMAHVLWKGGETCTEPEKAVALLNKAIDLQSDYWQAYARRGLAYSDMGMWDEAFDDLTRAVRQHPSAENYAWRGLTAFRMGNLMGARKDLARSLEMDSAQHRAWNFMGAVELADDAIPAACAAFAKGCSHGDCTGMESARREGICK
ncbi:MAG TPA: tetratricopeptide repeat protein [Nitratidesulfovibrio sp.]|nr:tetratricopeptide repeat protein [Nitratidesulfovibrio sp.]